MALTSVNSPSMLATPVAVQEPSRPLTNFTFCGSAMLISIHCCLLSDARICANFTLWGYAVFILVHRYLLLDPNLFPYIMGVLSHGCCCDCVSPLFLNAWSIATLLYTFCTLAQNSYQSPMACWISWSKLSISWLSLRLHHVVSSRVSCLSFRVRQPNAHALRVASSQPFQLCAM